MPYIGTQPTKVVSRQSANVYRYEAAAGQTAFTGADLDNNVLACNPADLIVHMNGLRLESTDYTATSTTVTLTTAATSGDEVTVTSFETFEVADTYTKTAADDRYVNTTGDTMTGSLFVGKDQTGTTEIVKNFTTNHDAANRSKHLRVGLTDGAFSGMIIENIAADNGINNSQEIKFDTHEGGVSVATRMKIDSRGRVTMPHQPFFQAYSPASATAAGANIVYGSTYANIGSHYNTSTGIFTAPIAGRYLFSASCLFNASAGSYHRLDFRVNGGISHTYGDSLENQNGPSYSSGVISNILNLSANDTVQMHNGGNVTTYGSSYGHFSGILIG